MQLTFVLVAMALVALVLYELGMAVVEHDERSASRPRTSRRRRQR